MIRRLGVGFLDVGEEEFIQMNMFYDVEKEERERKLEETINLIKVQNGKNSILRGMNFEEGATAKLRNTLVGGHKG
jgi:DNA polymerase V